MIEKLVQILNQLISIKRILLFLAILFFSTNLIAEEIIMKCKNYRYKFISDNSNVSIYSAHIERDKKNYHKFCPDKVADDNKHFLKSVEGAEMIITDYKVTCLTAKAVMQNGGIGTESTSITNFKDLTRNSECYWNGKKFNQSEKCKREKI